MIHRLIGRQLRDRRKDAVSVSGEHDDVPGHAAHVLVGRIGDEVDRIGAAAILGEAGVVEIELASDIVHHHILEHGAEPLRGRENLGLGVFGQADHLGVAAAFEIEDRGIGPAMLVVADQDAAGVGAERRLAGARQAEEHRGRTVVAHVRRAVHRHHALWREQIIEEAEH